MTTALQKSDFVFGNGNTSYYIAFDEAYNKLVGIGGDKSKMRFFVVFLTDGNNNGGDYNTQLGKLKSFLKPEGGTIEYGKIISVGFNYSNSILKGIASEGCQDDGNGCYYKVTSTNIKTVFTGFENVMKKQVKCSTYKKAKVVIQLSENFTFNDGSTEKTVSKDLICDASDLSATEQVEELLKDANYEIKFNKPKLEDAGTNEISLIESLKIQFYDASDSEVVDAAITMGKDDFPKIKSYITNASVIN